MDLLIDFKKTLSEKKDPASKTTIKNYIADVKKFISWFENAYSRQFPPSALPKEIVNAYLEKVSIQSPRSAKRYQSSLRKFFQFLVISGQISYNPLVLMHAKHPKADPFHLREFNNFLFSSHASPLTIKNYVMDVSQFLKWTEKVTSPEEVILSERKRAEGSSLISQQNKVLERIDNFLIEEYKNRLINQAQFSPVSINRKLSSLRKYFTWAAESGFLENPAVVPGSIITSESVQKTKTKPDSITANRIALEALRDQLTSDTPGAFYTPDAPKYSRFGPLRLMQKTQIGINWVIDALFILSIVKTIEGLKYNFWKITGKKVFASATDIVKNASDSASTLSDPKTLLHLDRLIISGSNNIADGITYIPKSVYAPLRMSTENFSFWQKIIFNIKYTRPKWYLRYHKYAFSHYLHFAIVLAFASYLGLMVYRALNGPQQNTNVLAAKSVTGRLISFQGRLSDINDTPIRKRSVVKFAIYPGSLSPRALWQETQTIEPDAEGKFSTILGKTSKIEPDIFSNNPNLFLGIKIGANPELEPRTEIANYGLSKTAQELQGLKPITGKNAGTENVILALDSSGNLTIGGNANPIFQATGGEFKLSGQQLTLATNEGSNTDIVINPDGTGIIDIQKPIQNTSEDSNSLFGGSVKIDDNLSIIATSSGQSALQINQNGDGDIISGLVSGLAKFTVSSSGSVQVGENLNILGNNLSTVAGTFNIANTITTTINLGGDATNISIGSKTGTTQINNSLNTIGPIIATGGVIIPDAPAGSIPYIGPSNQITADPNNLFWDGTNKRLGIGSIAPGFKLSVIDSVSISGRASAAITNASSTDSVNNVALRLNLGAPSTSNQSRFITFYSDCAAENCAGVAKGNIAITSSGVSYNTGSADFAEYFKKANPGDQFETGDIICHAKTDGVEKCQANSNGILGVYSKDAGFVGASQYQNNSNYVLVGLIGQLSLRIDPDSDDIRPGDPVTFNPETGLGTKASSAGQVVGRALESLDKTNQDKKLLKIALNVSWYDPKALLMDNGGLATAFETKTQSNDSFGTPDTLDTLDTLVTKPVLSIQNFLSTLKVGLLEAGEISTNSLSVATENITVGGQTLREYIASIVEEILDKKLAEKDGKTKIVILSPVARSETQASSSAQLAPDTPGTNQTASPSAAPTPLVVQNITNIYNNTSIATESATASPSATPSPLPVVENQQSPTPTEVLSSKYLESSGHDNQMTNDSMLNTKYLIQNTNADNIASFSAELSYIPNLKSDFLQINHGLTVLGPTSLSEAAVGGDLSIGKNMLISGDSINTIGTDLALQPLRQGNLSIMNGLVSIDTQGNLHVSGNAIFAKNVSVHGKLETGVISPLAGSDSINIDADLTSSQSAKFKRIEAKSLNLVRAAQADTSFTETIASASAGTAVITTYETQRTILTPFVTENSLIYITPINDTKGITPYIARQTAEDRENGIKGSFTIQIPSRQNFEIKVNWIIVN